MAVYNEDEAETLHLTLKSTAKSKGFFEPVQAGFILFIVAAALATIMILGVCMYYSKLKKRMKTLKHGVFTAV